MPKRTPTAARELRRAGVRTASATLRTTWQPRVDALTPFVDDQVVAGAALVRATIDDDLVAALTSR